MFYNDKRVNHHKVITIINLRQKLTKIKEEEENSPGDTTVTG